MNTNDLFAAAMNIDLDPIKAKLMHTASGEGWSHEKADAVEKEYRRFLCLMKMYPNEDTAPLVDVDTFWHYHILDTMKYAVDCQQVFGYFLHHYPYVGLGGEDDEEFRIDSGERMRTLYESTFGDAYPVGNIETIQATAYCAGPGSAMAGLDSRNDVAYCAGPGNKAAKLDLRSDIAYCAGPGSKPVTSGSGKEAAYCAGPGSKAAKLDSRNDISYCAGPGAKAVGLDAGKEVAYCAGPGSNAAKLDSRNDIAYCAGPGSKAMQSISCLDIAYCAGPGSMDKTKLVFRNKIAYCAGPGSKTNLLQAA